MKYAILPLVFLFSLSGLGQIVFSETFDEADNAITGVDNTAGLVTWTAACPGSLAATDYFKVLGGKLEAKDTNSPEATFTTGVIDISSCVGLAISLDIEEAGTLEGCADCGGTGDICVDFVRLQYDLDGAGWTDVAGTACPATMTMVPGLIIADGDLAGGGPLTYTSPCIDFGSTIRLRITCMTWAASEYWIFDNITVSCNDCVLPAEIVDYQAEQIDNYTQITWSTLSELNSDYFTIERSEDGQFYEFLDNVKGAGTSNKKINYSVTDRNQSNTKTTYYRLNQFDFDGKMSSTKITSLRLNSEMNFYFTPNELHYNIPKSGAENTLLNIYSIRGELLFSEPIPTGSGTIPWSKKGVFICSVDELNFKQKLVSP